MSESLRRIKSVRKDAIIVLTIREQCDMLLSAYKHHIRQTNDYFTFEEFLDSPVGLNYLKNSNYLNLLECIEHYFPIEQIKIFFYEDLKSDYSAFLENFYKEIIGLPLPANIKLTHVNKGLNDRQIKLKKFLNSARVFNEKSFLAKIDNFISKLAMKASGVFLNTNEKTITWGDSGFLNSIKRDFRKSNSEFGIKINVNMSQKGYLVNV